MHLELLARLERCFAFNGRLVDSTVGVLQRDSDIHPSFHRHAAATSEIGSCHTRGTSHKRCATLAGVSEDREERLAKNEVLFRTLNENIVGIAGTLGGETPYEFVCECATSGCFERLLLTLR